MVSAREQGGIAIYLPNELLKFTVCGNQSWDMNSVPSSHIADN